ncbi:MAG: hypothetical protein KC613_03355 [Myxococcales bacterium]|nr:hypothetical protein [Myxococcales bacterium]
MNGPWALGALGALALLAGCERDEVPPDAGVAGGADAAVYDPGARALPIRGCQAGTVPSVAGLWAVRFETAATLSGPGVGSQAEVVTRYAVAELCQDGFAVAGTVLTCRIEQSPVRDGSGTCAAQVPADALLAALPPSAVAGQLDPTSAQPRLQLAWVETWGLAEGAAPPAEPTGIAAADLSGVVDQDGDGHPGITVRGDGPVPTIAWVARRTEVVFDLLTDINALLLQGVASARTRQTVLGGPATRVLRGRRRADGQGNVAWIRLNGPAGQVPLDRNGDGALSCAELAALYGDPLAPPWGGACER